MQVHLGFHGIGEPAADIDTDERPYWVSVERFHTVLDMVLAAGRHTPDPERIGITFDDGNLSDFALGLPALKQRGQTAIFFIVTDRIGQPAYLAADDIRALHRAGMGIGSHGLAHVSWRGLTEEELTRHVSTSLATLSDIVGAKVDRVSVPFGAYDRRVLAVLRRLGVSRAYNSDFGPAWPDAWMLARNSVRSDTPLGEIRTLLGKRHSVLDQARARLRQWRRSRQGARGTSP